MAFTNNGFYQSSHTPRRKRVIAVAQAANFTMAIPAYWRVQSFHFKNNTANAVTGGLRVGNAAAGTQFVTAQPIAASVPTAFVAATAVVVSAAATLAYVEAVTAWNSATVDVVMTLEYCPSTGP